MIISKIAKNIDLYRRPLPGIRGRIYNSIAGGIIVQVMLDNRKVQLSNKRRILCWGNNLLDSLLIWYKYVQYNLIYLLDLR
jgi:hypothetical protein